MWIMHSNNIERVYCLKCTWQQVTLNIINTTVAKTNWSYCNHIKMSGSCSCWLWPAQLLKNVGVSIFVILLDFVLYLKDQVPDSRLLTEEESKAEKLPCPPF